MCMGVCFFSLSICNVFFKYKLFFMAPGLFFLTTGLSPTTGLFLHRGTFFVRFFFVFFCFIFFFFSTQSPFFPSLTLSLPFFFKN